jgi:hypothetical protein
MCLVWEDASISNKIVLLQNAEDAEGFVRGAEEHSLQRRLQFNLNF